MANWSNPVLTSTYTNFVDEVKNRDTDLALMFDPAFTAPTNVPTNAVRWNSASNKFQKWNGSAWNDLSATYVFPAVQVTTLAASGVISNTAGGAEFAAASTSAILKLSRTTTSAGAGWLGADASYAFRTYNSALTASALLVTQDAVSNTAIVNSTGLAVTGSVSAAGDNSSGNGSGQARLVANSSAASFANVSLQTNGASRWAIEKSGTESGSNAGGDLNFYRYTDAGGYLGNPLTISRATGLVTANSSLAVTGALSATASLGLNNGNTISFGGIGSDNYISGSAATDYLEIVTGGAQRVLVNNSGLSVTGALSATNAISTDSQITISKDGSDTIGVGSLLQIRNAAASRSWAIQLSASNNLDWWHLNGSWAKYMTLDANGNIGIAGTPLGTPSNAKVIEFGGTGGSLWGATGTQEIALATGVYMGAGGWLSKTNAVSAALYSQNNGVHNFYSATTGTVGSATTFQNQHRISKDGSQQRCVDGNPGTLYPDYAARAWVRFNGTGTPAISNNGNITSLTDNGVGDYTLNFNVSMFDATYAVAGTAGGSGVGVLVRNGTAAATNSVRVVTYNASWIATDFTEVSATIIR